MPLRRVYSTFLLHQTTRSKAFQLLELERAWRSSFTLPTFGKVVKEARSVSEATTYLFVLPSLTEILLFFSPLELLPGHTCTGGCSSLWTCPKSSGPCLVSFFFFLCRGRGKMSTSSLIEGNPKWILHIFFSMSHFF